MAAIDFPSSPSTNQTHTASGVTWTWDGTTWKAQGSTTTYTLPTASTGTLGGIKVGNNFAIDGAGTLSLSAAAISGLSDVTAASADYLMLWDASDSSLKKVDAGELLGGGGGGLSSIGIQSGGTQIGAGITQLNFIGTGNTFAVSSNTVDVSIGGDTVDAIIPVAYAFVNADTAGTGTGMSWGAYNSSNGRMEFTFGTALSDANYYVLSEREQYDTHSVHISNKTTTGFRATWYGNDGTSPLAPSIFGGVLIVYGSNPLTSVGALNTGSGSIAGISTLATSYFKHLNITGVTTTPAVDVDDWVDVGNNIQLGNAGVATATLFNATTGVFAPYADIDDWIDVGNNIQLGNAGVITATSYVGSGANLTALNATNLGSGTVPTARLGSGTANNSVFLRGDNTWATPSGGISNVVEDTTPQLGGNLDLNSKTINGTGTINITGTITADAADIDDWIDVGSNIQLGNAGVVTATSYVGSGSALTNLNATKITSGTVPTARLGSGTANNSVFLRGDNTWATPSGGGGSATTINNQADNRLITCTGTADTLNGESLLTFDGTKLLVASNSYNVLELRADENNDGANDDSIINFTHDGTLRAEIRYDESSSTLELATSDNRGDIVIDASGNTVIGGGINITGVATATSFDGELAYDTAWTLGANGSTDYTFTGNGLDGAVNDPTIYVTRGQKYAFKNRSGGHPFRIQTSFQNTSGTAYNDGVTNNSAGNGTDLIWNVQFDAPDVLYYQCTAHTNMSGKIIVLGGDTGRTTTSATTGSIAQAAYADITIPTTGKTFALLKIAISAPAWVVLYSDTSSRTSDAAGTGSGRSEGTDPTPGSGVLAEVSTTTSGASTFKMTPGLIGWNDDGTPAAQIYARVYNKRATSGSNTITVTLTSVIMEV